MYIQYVVIPYIHVKLKKPYIYELPSMKLTTRTWKLMVGILISFRGPFSGAMLPSWWVSTHQTGSLPQIGMNIKNIWNHCNHHPISCRECHINHLLSHDFSDNHLLARRRRRWPIDKKKPSIQGGKVRLLAKWWRRSCFCYILKKIWAMY